MRKILFLALFFAPCSLIAQKIACVCNDKSLMMPQCGICGTELGTMESTKMGVACICENKLKLKEISCADICKAYGGWSGQKN